MTRVVEYLLAYGVLTILRTGFNFIAMSWIARREVRKLDLACAESFDNVSADFAAVFDRLNDLTNHADQATVMHIKPQGHA